MKITLRGTRGSIPSPGPDTIGFGGNTTCVEILTTDGKRIILDAGSGIRRAGEDLLKEMPLECALFISHTHWDHIHGLPFFVPLFVPGNRITIYGPPDPVSLKTMQDALAVQMTHRYFPVREAELKSDIEYVTLREGEPVQVGSATVTSIMMNHTVVNFGYKVEEKGHAFFFSGDHEPYMNIYRPEDEDFEEYDKIILQKNQIIEEFLHGCDAVLLDAQYTEQEYPAKTGWGHSTFDQAAQLAIRAGAPRVLLTHHDPARTDAQLTAVEADLIGRYPDGSCRIEVAREGSEIVLE